MDEIEFKALRELSNNGRLSQRELSRRIGISLGSVNYVLKRLMEKGFIKANRFKNSKSKLSYMYVLTPKGIEERINQTKIFLKRTYDEYITLTEEIKKLENDGKHY